MILGRGYFSEYGNPNTITIAYSDIEGGEAGIVTNNNGTVNCLEGNIDSDPLFVDPANANFHLSWANFPIPDETKSPCIDAGDPNSPFDPDGTIADMGAFYFNQSIVSQQIYLSSGFSFVSSHIIPDNPDMLVVMADVLNDNLDFWAGTNGLQASAGLFNSLYYSLFLIQVFHVRTVDLHRHKNLWMDIAAFHGRKRRIRSVMMIFLKSSKNQQKR